MLNPETEAKLRAQVPCPESPQELGGHPPLVDHHGILCTCHGSGEVPKYPALWGECHFIWCYRPLCKCQEVHSQSQPGFSCDRCSGTGLVFAPTLEGLLESAMKLDDAQKRVFFSEVSDDTFVVGKNVALGYGFMEDWFEMNEAQRFKAAALALAAAGSESPEQPS